MSLKFSETKVKKAVRLFSTLKVISLWYGLKSLRNHIRVVVRT